MTIASTQFYWCNIFPLYTAYKTRKQDEHGIVEATHGKRTTITAPSRTQ